MLQVPSFIAGAIVAAETDGLATLPANLAKRLAARWADRVRNTDQFAAHRKFAVLA